MAQAMTGPGPADLRGDPRRRRKEAIIRYVFLATAAASVVVSALIVLSLFGKALNFLGLIELGRLWAEGWFPRSQLFDVKTIVGGTLVVTCIAMLIATPLGLGAAIYLSEYATPRARRLLKPVLEILAGIPSVVIGYFALIWLSPQIIQRLCTDANTFNMAAAGIGVGILVTPLVASITEDSMRAVPLDLREASYGLGARKRTTTTNIVIPAAISGILAALIVGISRAIGETMVVAIAAGATGGSSFQLDPCQPGQTMTAAMTAVAIGSDQVAQENVVDSLYFVGLLLFLMTLTLNIVSNRIVKRVRLRY
ncbi:MAG: phosphate ABC transporter permease subunit PstC [Actinomycetota bacterium]